ncbi:unnamed protein product [Boreogadus saida]
MLMRDDDKAGVRESQSGGSGAGGGGGKVQNTLRSYKQLLTIPGLLYSGPMADSVGVADVVRLSTPPPAPCRYGDRTPLTPPRTPP